VALEIKQAKFENGEQATRTRPNNNNIRGDHVKHE
jgi:hypothetical protein